MARYSGSPPKGRTSWKRRAGVAAGAAVLGYAAKRYLTKTYARKTRDRSPLEWNAGCSIPVMCAQRCFEPGVPRLVYKLPVLSNAVLRAAGNDHMRLENVRLAIRLAPYFNNTGFTCETQALETIKPYWVRAMLCKEKVATNATAIIAQANLFPDPFDLTDWSDYPAMRRSEYLNMGGNTQLGYSLVQEGGVTCGISTKPHPTIHWKYRIPSIVLTDDDSWNMYITYGGLTKGGDDSCIPEVNTVEACQVGFYVALDSQATIID